MAELKNFSVSNSLGTYYQNYGRKPAGLPMSTDKSPRLPKLKLVKRFETDYSNSTDEDYFF